MLIAIISLQTGASLAKSLFSIVGATGIMSLRLGLGTIILCIILKPWKIRFVDSNFIQLLIYGVSLGTMNFTFYLSISTIPIGLAVALEFIGPLTVSLISLRNLKDFIWVFIAIIGLYFLLPFQTKIENIDLHGEILAICAGICWAIYIIAGQRTGTKYGSVSAAIGFIIASIIFVPLGLIFAKKGIWQWQILPSSFLVALLSTVIPYSLEMVVLTKLPSRTFSILMSLEPAMATLSGMIFLGETLTFKQYIGLLAIIISSIGSILTIKQNI